MIDSGIEAIIVKVASIGLQPRKHLGRTIADLQMEFLQLVWRPQCVSVVAAGI